MKNLIVSGFTDARTRHPVAARKDGHVAQRSGVTFLPRVCIVVQGFPGAGIKPGLSGVAWVRQGRGRDDDRRVHQPG
jgi:hypothetical protein